MNAITRTIAATVLAVATQASLAAPASVPAPVAVERTASYLTTADGVQLYYKDWGPKNGPVVTFSHGWPLSSDSWESQMIFLAEKGYRVIAHDRRSHGRSDQTWTGNHMDQYADDLAELIEALDLEFASGLGALTGETGAGKSILLDSLGLALGARADRLAADPAAPHAAVQLSVEHRARVLDEFRLLGRPVVPNDHSNGEILEGTLEQVRRTALKVAHRLDGLGDRKCVERARDDDGVG